MILPGSCDSQARRMGYLRYPIFKVKKLMSLSSASRARFEIIFRCSPKNPFALHERSKSEISTGIFYTARQRATHRIGRAASRRADSSSRGVLKHPTCIQFFLITNPFGSPIRPPTHPRASAQPDLTPHINHNNYYFSFSHIFLSFLTYII